MKKLIPLLILALTVSTPVFAEETNAAEDHAAHTAHGMKKHDDAKEEMAEESKEDSEAKKDHDHDHGHDHDSDHDDKKEDKDSH